MSSDQIIRSFSAFIGRVEEGQLHADLSRAIEEIVAGLNGTAIAGGKPKAKLALSFDFKLTGGVLEVECDYKLTLPKAERQRSIFWSTPDNHLSLANPRQPDFFRDVAKLPAPAVAAPTSVA